MRILFVRETLLGSGIQVSTNHLFHAVEHLGHEPLWVTRPLTPISLLGALRDWNQFRLRLRLWLDNWSATPPAQLSLFTPVVRKRQIAMTGRGLLRTMFRWAVPSLPSALARRHWDRADVLWLSDPVQAGIRLTAPHARLLFQVTDDYRAFDNFDKDVDAEIAEVLNEADAVIFTNKALLEHYHREFGLDPGRCRHVSHGIERAAVEARPPVGDTIEAVFVGNINDWIDWDFLDALVRAVPRLRITFFGPISAAARSRMDGEIFRYRGMLARADVPDALAPFHYGLIPFRRSPLKQFSEPMKFYDYIAAGLPVLSTIDLDPALAAGFGDGVVVTGDVREALTFIDRLPASYIDFREKHAERCLGFVDANTWEWRAQEVLNWLTTLPSRSATAGVEPAIG